MRMGIGVRSLFTFVLSLAGIAIAAPIPPATTTQLRFVAFNIRYFGSGGSGRGTSADEKRDATVRDFIAKNVLPADVISFEEITDVPRLRKVLPKGWDCVSYDEEDLEHQHVVLCASPKFDWRREPTDDNWTWESLVIPGGKLRPAVHAILTETRTNRELVRVVGLHLKAFPDKSDVRLKQMTLLATELRRVRNLRLPTVILGDLNTYPAPQNTLKKDDEILIEEVLDQNFAFSRVPNVEMTFRSPTLRGRYDQIYFSNNLRMVDEPSVYPLCGRPEGATGTGYMNPAYYYEKVSDHCPLAITLGLGAGSRYVR